MSASEIRRIARENLEGNWKISVTAAFVAALLGGLIASSNININIDERIVAYIPEWVIVLLSAVVTINGALNLPRIIIGGVVEIGYAQLLLKQYNRAEFEVKDLFSQFDRFGQGFLQHFLRGLYTFLWMLLFIIPGIVKSYSYAMTPFILAENPNMSAQEAITASKELMDGHKYELFCLDFSFIGWCLLNIFTLGFGSLFLNPYMNAAHAAFYKTITANRRIYE